MGKSFFTASLMTAAISGRGLVESTADLDAGRFLRSKDTCIAVKEKLHTVMEELDTVKDELKTEKTELCDSKWEPSLCGFCSTPPIKDAKKKTAALEALEDATYIYKAHSYIEIEERN